MKQSCQNYPVSTARFSSLTRGTQPKKTDEVALVVVVALVGWFLCELSKQ